MYPDDDSPPLSRGSDQQPRVPAASVTATLSDAPEYRRPPSKASIILVDPKPFTRRLIADMLARAFPEYTIAAVGDIKELVCTAEEEFGIPALLLMYVRSCSVSDPFVTLTLERLRSQLPDVPTILLSDRTDLTELNRALSQGIRGYIPTTLVCDIALAALKFIDAGGTYIPPDIIYPNSRDAAGESPRGEQQLTRRELAIVELMRRGTPNKMIARELDLQESTVKVHVRNILRKIHASNRTHAVSVLNEILPEREK